MEQYLGFLPYFVGIAVTFYRAWLSLQDWQRIKQMPDDTRQQAAFRLACMIHHLNEPIGRVSWQIMPAFIGAAISAVLFWLAQG